MENVKSFSSKQIYVEVSFYIQIFCIRLNNKSYLTEKEFHPYDFFQLIMNSLFYFYSILLKSNISSKSLRQEKTRTPHLEQMYFSYIDGTYNFDAKRNHK